MQDHRFFGISPASLQVGGGTLLPISVIQMLNAKQVETRPDDVNDVNEGSRNVDAGASIAVVPLTMAPRRRLSCCGG